MAKPNSRETLIDYCKRALGHPVIEINVDDDQVDDRIDEALQFYQEYHADAIEKVYLKHLVTTADQTNGYITVPELVTNVVRVFPLRDASTNINMFDAKYQMHLNDMFSLGYMGSLLEYEMTQQWLSMLDMIIDSDDKHLDYNRHSDRLYIHMDWSEETSAQADVTIGVEHDGTAFTLNGVRQATTDWYQGKKYTFDVSHSSMSGRTFRFKDHSDGSDYTTGVTVYGTPGQTGATVVLQTTDTTPGELDYHDPNTVGIGATVKVIYQDSTWLILETYRILDPTTYTEVFNDYFLKRYATALIKQQWGQNLIKFEGMQMPGGVTFNGRQIYDDATQDLEKLTEEARLNWEEPIDFMTG